MVTIGSKVPRLPGRLLVFCFLVFSSLAPVWGQERPSVADYFAVCPFVVYQPDSDRWLFFSRDEPFPGAAENTLVKQLLLQGVSLDIRDPVRNLVVDLKNGYLHFTVGADDFTLVYYERADKSRIVGLRLEDRSGPFWSAEWAFYDVQGNRWSLIPDEEILPNGWLRAFLPRDLGRADTDGLALSWWDIALPRFGTTAHLLPQSYGSDLDGPKVMVTVPGTQRKTNLWAYYDWFHRVFSGKDKQPQALSLKWSKSAGRFETGPVVAWLPESQDEPPRPIWDLLHHPRNVWEAFLANPELVYDGNEGLHWAPGQGVPDEEYRDASMDSQTPPELKQELLGYRALGLMRERPDRPMVIDLPGRYLHFELVRMGPDPQGGEEAVEEAGIDFTLVSFDTEGGPPVVGYRFWGSAGDHREPRTEQNQVTATFYGYSPSGDLVGKNEDEVFPLDRINGRVLDGGTVKDQALQKVLIWDVVFLRGTSTVQLVPWRLAYLSDQEKKPLLALFGSESELARAFEEFVKRWYGGKALALDWNPQTERFGNLRLSSRKP